MPSLSTYLSISSITEEMTSFERPVTVKATEVVSRSQGKASVVRMGFPWKKFHSRSCSTRETRFLMECVVHQLGFEKLQTKGESLRVARGFQYEQLGEVLLEGITVGCYRMEKFRVPL